MNTTVSEQRYIDLLKRILTNTIFCDPAITGGKPAPYDSYKREIGADWPRDAHTMMGRRRLDNLDLACRTVIREGVPGDFLEAGVWRGGAGVLMRGILEALGEPSRRVILADSFEGLPRPDETSFPADKNDDFWTYPDLAVSLEDVKENIARYGLLDERIIFLKGWFKDTLQSAPTDAIAIARLDGDMYESTWQALTALYPRCSPGAFIILDDYGCVPGCRAAASDFRKAFNIDDPIHEIDWTGVYWRKSVG
jgi:hypothetical protein